MLSWDEAVSAPLRFSGLLVGTKVARLLMAEGCGSLPNATGGGGGGRWSYISELYLVVSELA